MPRDMLFPRAMYSARLEHSFGIHLVPYGSTPVITVRERRRLGRLSDLRAGVVVGGTHPCPGGHRWW